MLNKNLMVLKEYYPELYKRIIEVDNTRDLQEVTSKNGMNNLIINNELWVHSKYDPENEALKFVDNIYLDEEEDTILIIGLGLAYYLEKLVEKYKNKKLIIIEPNINIFKKMLNVRDISELLKCENIVFIVEVDPYIVRNLISHYLIQNKIKKVYIKEMPIYKRMNNNYIEELYKEINKGLFQIQGNIATERAFSQMWLNNTIRVLEYIKKIPNVNVMKDEFKNIPVVIVSAGPSLDKNVKYLKTIYNKALIIAVGSAVNILEKNGITPHIIMGIDGQELEAKLFQSLTNTKSVFVFGPSVHYKAVECYKGPKMYLLLNNDVTMIELVNRLNLNVDVFSCGPSISNVALVFAHYLKASQIIIIGQDLAYTSNKRYANGGIHNENIENDEYLKEKIFQKRIDIYGKEVYTRSEFIGIKNWFEDYIKVFKNEIEVYNCIEAGLGIEGMPNMKLKDAIKKFCVNDFDVYNKLMNLFKEKNDSIEQKFEKLLFKYNKEIDKLIELSKYRLEEINKMIKIYDENSFSENLKKVLNLCDEIESYDTFKIFVAPTGSRYINSITNGINNKIEKLDNIDDKNKIILNGLALQYEYIDKCLYIIKQAFNKNDIEYNS